MAAHLDTGTTRVTPPYRSQTLDHLGLVAGMFDELGMREVLDRVIPQNRNQRRVWVGQAVKPAFRTPLQFRYRAPDRVAPITGLRAAEEV